MAEVNRTLYRNGQYGHGLIQVLPTGETRLVLKASQLAPIIIDSISIRVTKEGKPTGELPAASQLNAMLKSEQFLTNFRSVDHVIRTPLYQDDFSLIPQGYSTTEVGDHYLNLGPAPQSADSMDTIRSFLDVMDFETNADRTNAVAAALTVLLRNHWPGEKPVILITATKSHAGKGTVTEFIRGSVPKADILYESMDWPMQSQFQRQLTATPDLGVICLDNVRLDSAGGRAKFIRSAFIESFVTTSDITLASPSAGDPVRVKNQFVLSINTNDGLLSPDLMNRAVSIRLAPKGNIQDRKSPIGNPKLEFLPQNQERIEAELRGMIERWKQAGCPLDQSVRHPMSRWAKTVGGILEVSGFEDFLANYGTQKTVADPIREALSLLGAASPDKPLRPIQWAKLAVEQGLARTLFSTAERDSEKGRERAIGIRLKTHLEETFEVTTDTSHLSFRLDGGFRRWVRGKNPHTRYIFQIIDNEELAAEQAEGDER